MLQPYSTTGGNREGKKDSTGFGRFSGEICRTLTAYKLRTSQRGQTNLQIHTNFSRKASRSPLRFPPENALASNATPSHQSTKGRLTPDLAQAQRGEIRFALPGYRNGADGVVFVKLEADFRSDLEALMSPISQKLASVDLPAR